MLTLSDILDVDSLEDLILNKRINVQVHPTLPLRIYNYSNMAQFANEWSNEERVCRGLIVGPDDEIIARGPSKFFNYGQPGAPEVSMDDTVRITHKEDGSLGIGWHYDGHYGVATRGSFTSDQAVHAAGLLTDDQKERVKEYQEEGRSAVWEIVYPENRIVLDYAGRDELIFLGLVRNDSGLISIRPATVLVWPDSEAFVLADPGHFDRTFAEALSLPIPDDEEGYVLDIIGEDGWVKGHIKLKGDRYKELHGAIFGLSERRIWEAIGEGRDMDMFVADLPDELQPWAQGVVDRINHKREDLVAKVKGAFNSTYIAFDEPLQDVPRGEVARHFGSMYPDIKGPLFSMLDGNDKAVLEWAHKQVRPEHKLFRVESQDSN